MKQSRLCTLVLLNCSCLLLSCRSGDRGAPGVSAVTIDLNHIAPIGYEICAERPPKISAGNVDLTMLLPQRIEIPPEQAHYGSKSVEFREGEHEVDVYKDLQSPRLIYTRGSLAIENGRPAMHVKLKMANLSKGRYVIGISGDPFFAYCSVDLQ